MIKLLVRGNCDTKIRGYLKDKIIRAWARVGDRQSASLFQIITAIRKIWQL